MFDPPIQCSIELLASSRDPDATLANLAEFSSSDEACSWLFGVRTLGSSCNRTAYQKFLGSFLDLFDFGIGKALDSQKLPACGAAQSL